MIAANIRPYGPGKFSTMLDAYVYSVTLDGGCDDEIRGEYGTWYGLMKHGSTIFRDHDPLLDTLNDDERDQLISCAGVIVREDSDGFVYVRYFDETDELDAAWDTLRDENDTEDEDED